MKVVAYTYEADVHCPACTAADAARGILRRNQSTPPERDEHGIAGDLVDREGNHTLPVFSTYHELAHCGDCGACL